YIYIHVNKAIAEPISPIVKPSTINGNFMKLSLPPTYLIISISSFLLYTLVFIVFDIITKQINIKNTISILPKFLIESEILIKLSTTSLWYSTFLILSKSDILLETESIFSEFSSVTI